MRLRIKIFTSAALLAISACVSADTQGLRDEPSYQTGYGDGCSTAMEEDKSFSTKRMRDEYMFDNDRAYRAGWRQGYLECGEHIPEPKTGGRILGEDGQL